jgi:hypothetical protein
MVARVLSVVAGVVYWLALRRGATSRPRSIGRFRTCGGITSRAPSPGSRLQSRTRSCGVGNQLRCRAILNLPAGAGPAHDRRKPAHRTVQEVPPS